MTNQRHRPLMPGPLTFLSTFSPYHDLIAWLIKFKVFVITHKAPHGLCSPPLSNLVACRSSSPVPLTVVFRECTKRASTAEPLELLFPLPGTLFWDTHISYFSPPQVSAQKSPCQWDLPLYILYKIISPLLLQTSTTLSLFIFIHSWHFPSSDVLNVYLVLK